jgi:hypothetical protein
LILFLFHLDVTVVPSFTGGGKGFGGEDVHLQVPLIDVEGIATHESGMIDVALALRREGVFDLNAVCDLLTEYLEDVRFAIFVMLWLFTLLLGFNFSLLLFQAMKLTKAAETIIAEDNGALIQKCIAELEKDKQMLQRVMDHSAEDYDLPMAGNRKLVSQRDHIKHRCESPQAKLVQVRSNTERQVADLKRGLGLPKPAALTLPPRVRKNCEISRVGLFKSWKGCASCMLTTFRPLGACVHRCRLGNLQLKIICAGSQRRHSASLTCSTA